MGRYCCGPTVYDAAHVGHARAYVTTDIVRRVVEDWLRVPVRFVLGLTDVDDKIIDRAASTGVSPGALARRFEAEFVEDMCRLNVRAPSAMSRVTDHVPQIVAFVERLVARGHAYRAGDGSVYFDHTTFAGEQPAWARPQPGDDACGTHAGVRAEGQRHARDFALWKAVPGGVLGESAWQSPFGLGRPGWHIECSAMSQYARACVRVRACACVRACVRV
jgi:cysteinyl-tRNA synthetase